MRNRNGPTEHCENQLEHKDCYEKWSLGHYKEIRSGDVTTYMIFKKQPHGTSNMYWKNETFH